LSDSDRKTYLRFVAKLTELASTYDAQQLREFRRMSAQQMPLVADLIDVLLRIEESPKLSSLDYRPSKIQPLNVFDSTPRGKNRVTSVSEILNDHRLFPTNTSLARFGAQFMDVHVGRSTRARIIRRMLNALLDMDPGRRATVENALRDLRNAAAHGNTSDFMARWERVIKDAGGAASTNTSSSDGRL
jgi:hypothetical protein